MIKDISFCPICNKKLEIDMRCQFISNYKDHYFVINKNLYFLCYKSYVFKVSLYETKVYFIKDNNYNYDKIITLKIFDYKDYLKYYKKVKKLHAFT